MKKILVFSFSPAFVPPKSGGEVRLFNFYFELSRYFDITLLSSGHVGVEHEVVFHKNNFVEKRIPKDSYFVEQWQELTPHAGEGDLSGPCIAACGKFLTELHRAYLEEYTASDIIIHESPFTVDYDLFIGLDEKPRIYNSYNCEFELYKKLHIKSQSTLISDLVYSAELKILKNVDLVTYCGEDDILAFEKMLNDKLKRKKFLPNGMTITPVYERRVNEKSKRAIFIGSGHLPNVEAANFIVEILAPACPEIIFDIIGNCLPVGEYPRNVIRHGVVDLKVKSELMASAAIAVNPMLTGSGSSLKIMDFISYGIPVLSTPIGMRGFGFRNQIDCILRDAEDFPAALLEYFNKFNSIELIEMGLSAREFAIENYAWTAVAKSFGDIIDELLAQNTDRKSFSSYVLALNDYDPFGAVGGGATRLNGLYQTVAEWSNVVVLCFSNASTIEVRDIAPKIKCLYVPKTADHVREEEYFNGRFHISANDIVALRHAGKNTTLNSVYEILRSSARIVVCDHPYMIALPDRFGDRFIYSSQNFEYGLKKSMLEWHPDKELLLEEVECAEKLCISSSAAVIAVSLEDAKNLTRGVRASAPVLVIPNGAAVPVEPSFEKIALTKDQIAERSAVFLGSAHMPNVDAAKYISEILAAECSDVQFHIIGSVCQALSGPILKNVKLWGILDDGEKSAVMQQCALAINPMFSGSGSNVKLADFIANGLHVISTSFGIRGYPDSIAPHITITSAELFSKTILDTLNNPELNIGEKREQRKSIFITELSINSLANKFVDLLKNLEKKKKRMLFVTTRYTDPILGGAESMLATLMEGVGRSGKFDVDIIAAEVSSISEVNRFCGRYGFDGEYSSPIGLQNVRFARFPVSEIEDEKVREKCIAAWRVQSQFEKHLYLKRKESIKRSGLAWGWGYPEGEGSGRWGFSECGMHVIERTHINIKGFVPHTVVLLVRDSSHSVLLHTELESYFEFSFNADPGAVEFYFTVRKPPTVEDPRPLAAYVQQILMNGVEIEISAPNVFSASNEDALSVYTQMESASRLSRSIKSISLTDIRGPNCPEMDKFIEENIKNYDIVVTHNSVFRPAVFAISAAKVAGVPSILIPHAHLDDDFYHFPDVHQAALDASIVLAAPKAACHFYERMGASQTKYLPSGVDISESFSDEDERNFRSVYKLDRPFFLVLGRKSGAKGYLDVIKAVEEISENGNFHLVMIGPDDDGIPINSKHATYLGQQPRSVVRGALRSCLALVNMSSSESFGMVLLEAWLAGRPVVVNAECSAFLDLAIHEQNALLVTKNTLPAALIKLGSDRHIGEKLGLAGKEIVDKYSWDNVCSRFLDICEEVI